MRNVFQQTTIEHAREAMAKVIELLGAGWGGTSLQEPPGPGLVGVADVLVEAH